jgi:protein SCO1/2
MRRFVIGAVSLVVVAGVVVGMTARERSVVRRRRARAYVGYVVNPPRPLPPVVLVDSAGKPVVLSKVGASGAALVYFGYTNCPDACPTTLADWRQVKRQLGPDERRVRFVFITVDPAHDTRQVLRDYLRQFDPEIIGLTGTKEALDSAQNALLVQELEDDPMSLDSHAEGFSHAVAISLVDSAGRLRVALPVHSSPRAAVRDVRLLLSDSLQ